MAQITNPERDLNRLYRQLEKALDRRDLLAIRNLNVRIERLETFMVVGRG